MPRLRLQRREISHVETEDKAEWGHGIWQADTTTLRKGSASRDCLKTEFKQATCDELDGSRRSWVARWLLPPGAAGMRSLDL
ncbi:MAG: hypothetical protein HY913_03410 [Desulfomonile tiedjei]|nr:hypothetical protein [Desulfomonile tiedjei]